MDIFVETQFGGYPIRLERGGLSRAASFLSLSRRGMVVTD